jgi:hypothetical protein
VPSARVGQRVWVACAKGRAFGHIAYVPRPSAAPAHFVVVLEGETVAITCTENRKGEMWDFVDLET